MVLQNCDTSDDSKKKSATQHQYDEIEQVYAVLRPTLVMLVAARQHVCVFQGIRYTINFKAMRSFEGSNWTDSPRMPYCGYFSTS